MQISRTASAVRSPNGKFVLEVGGRPLFEMSPVAENIWTKLAEGLPAQEIISQLTAQFNVPEERVRNDVTSFLGLLRRHLLVSDALPNMRRDPIPLAELVWNKGIASMCDWRIPDEFPPGQGYKSVPDVEGHIAPPHLLSDLISDVSAYQDIHDGQLVWAKLSWLKSFIRQVLPSIKAKFILVTGDSDTSVPSGAMLESQMILRNSNIVHWFAQNCDSPDPTGRMSPIPIGIDFHTLCERRLWGESISSSKQQEIVLQSVRRNLPKLPQRIRKVYIDFAWQPPNFRLAGKRQEIVDQVRGNDCVYLQQGPLRRSRMWRERGEYAFVLSPHGVGLDCHRTWEALALGHIVLVPKSPLDSLYAGLPVIPIADWNEIKTENIEKWLVTHSALEIDGEKLRSRYWTKKMRATASQKIKSAQLGKR